jgi:hypothetical protein
LAEVEVVVVAFLVQEVVVEVAEAALILLLID